MPKAKEAGLMPGRQPDEFLPNRRQRAEDLHESRQAEDKIDVVGEGRRGLDQVFGIIDKTPHVGHPGQTVAFQLFRQSADVIVKRDRGQIAIRIEGYGLHDAYHLSFFMPYPAGTGKGKWRPCRGVLKRWRCPGQNDGHFPLPVVAGSVKIDIWSAIFKIEPTISVLS